MSKRLITALLVLLAIGVQAFAQSAVSGRVTDEAGEPLVGANVLVKGTTTGTMTDYNGNYSLNVRQGAVLVFSSIGYATQEIQVTQGVINVTLKNDTNFLDDVVVVAYGTAKKRDLTGAMTAIKGENIAAQNVSTISRALEGAAPGIQLSSVDGQPGLDMVIRVRGAASTIDGSAMALVVIDGVPAQTNNPLSTINPSDIASISVLKDAASTALYGSRGANGVILVTTKKGEGGGRAQVSFDTRIGWNSVGQFAMSNMTKASDIYEFAWKSIYNSYRYGVDGTGNPKVGADGIPYTNFSNPNHTHEEAALFASQHLFNYMNSETSFSRNTLRNALVYDVPGMNLEFTGTGTSRSATMIGAYLVNPDGKINPEAKYFLQKENEYSSLFSNAFRQEYNVSIRGGNEKLNYFVSLGYDEDPSYIPTSAFNRYTGRAAINAQPLKWLKIGTNIGYTRTKTNEMATRYGRNPGSAGGNVFRYVNGTSNLIPIYMLDENHNYVYDASGNKLENITNGTETYSPLGPTVGNAFGKGVMNEFAHNKNETIRSIWTSRSYAQVLFTKDLNFLVNFNYDSDDTDYNRYRAAGTYNGGTNGGLNQTLTNRFILNTQQMLNYSHDFGDHHVDAMAGHEWNDDTYNSLLYVSGYELIPDWISAGNFIGRYTNGGTTLSGSPGWTQYILRMESYFGRLNYNYAEKYYLSGSLREDGSSKFVNDRWGLFGSVGAGWVISKERFMDSTNNWLDLLKIRSSWGVLGNQNGIDYYSGYQRWGYGGGNWTAAQNNYPQSITLSKSAWVNDGLTWENVHTTDAGFDASLFGGKVTATVDFFNKHTVNAIWGKNVSILAAGQGSVPQNTAGIRNRGIEFDLAYQPIHTKDWDLLFSVNGTHYNTILTSVPEGPDYLFQASPDAWTLQGTGAGSTEYLRGVGRDYFNMYIYRYGGVAGNPGLKYYGSDGNWHTGYTKGDPDAGHALFWRKISADDVKAGTFGAVKEGDDILVAQSANATRYEIGDALPELYGGFSTFVRFKGFDLSAQFAYQIGGKFLSLDYGSNECGKYMSGFNVKEGQAISTELVGNTWSESNQGAKFPMNYYSGDQTASGATQATSGINPTDLCVFDASYLAVKNVTVGYTFPKALVNKIKIANLRVYASADNPALLFSHSGVDPRWSMTGGIEVGAFSYPYLSVYTFGVNVDF